MIRVAVVGLGKMGLSLHAIINAHEGVKVVAVCDAAGYVLDVLSKYTGIKTYTDYQAMLSNEELDAVVIATPSRLHYGMVRVALEKGLHVFCEKPFTLDPEQSQELSELAVSKGLINQVGYHNRFVGAFQEVKRLLEVNAIGKVSHVLAESYGPVVLKPKGSTWRTKGAEGGGCIYDYAAHPLNLVTWYFGAPTAVAGTVLNSIHSKEIDDEVYGTLYFDQGISAQLSVNWSDESYRKMTTKISIWGAAGRIYADRQEIQVYLRDPKLLPDGYKLGWNVRYTTELTKPVDFYIRGEEYSAELDHFAQSIQEKRIDTVSSFADAAVTDKVIAMMIDDYRTRENSAAQARKSPSWFGL